MRFVVVFAAFVACGSLLLLGWLQHLQQAEEERVFTTLAMADADFVQQLNLPRSARLAGDLGQLLRMQIHFRDAQGLLEPGLAASEAARLQKLPVGSVQELPGGWQALALHLDEQHDMLFLRREPGVTLSLWHPATRHALLTFWLLSAALGWIIAGQVVRPVSRLTRGLPGLLEQPDLAAPGVERGDEIGDLARTLTQARDDLLAERAKREQSERMALLGRVATGLAHEIKNPLASIQLHAQLMDASALDAESAQSLKHVQSEARVIEGLVNQWLYLTRPAPPKAEPLALGQVLAGTLEAVQAQADHAAVEIVVEPHLPEWQVCLRGDRARLQQAFRNIVVNAIQAMPRGGRLLIQLVQEASGLRLCFQDTGGGFSAAALEHGADLFFSEKEGGMGVGLNVVKEILAAHGGGLRLTNAPGGGARVEVVLAL